MNIRFNKFHGTGNDFVMTDNRAKLLKLSKETIALLCNRHFGIGADGLILIGTSDDCDFEMKYFNSDGNEGSMCGNGGRCAIAFASLLGIIQAETIFKTFDGLHKGEITGVENNTWNVKLQLNDLELPTSNAHGYLLNTGSPHLVIFSEDNSKLDVYAEGRKIRYSSNYKDEGINVNFVTVFENYISVRTYERGVEQETLSCGTGVTASAIVSAIRFPQFQNKVNIQTKGGLLSVSFVKEENKIINVWLEGSASFVFEGEIKI